MSARLRRPWRRHTRKSHLWTLWMTKIYNFKVNFLCSLSIHQKKKHRTLKNTLSVHFLPLFGWARSQHDSVIVCDKNTQRWTSLFVSLFARYTNALFCMHPTNWSNCNLFYFAARKKKRVRVVEISSEKCICLSVIIFYMPLLTCRSTFRFSILLFILFVISSAIVVVAVCCDCCRHCR